MQNNTPGIVDDALILIVDDTPKNLQLLGNLLSREGYKLAALTKGEQVLSSVEKLHPDLVLLDVMMPDKNGFDVCKDLKADPELADIPIIFLTGKAEQEDIIEGLKIGGSDYVTKPFNTQELLARVATHVELKKSRDIILEQNDQLQALNRTRDKLYSIIGHDLRGGITGIDGVSGILVSEVKEGKTDLKEMGRLLKMINHSASKLRRLLDNLLGWARLQTGNLQLDIKEIPLGTVISGVEELFVSRASEKGITLEFDDKGNYIIEGDKNMLETVIRNLVSNALKFTREGGRIGLSVDEKSDTIALMVTDDGTGMTEEIRQNLFNPEERPLASGTQNEKGTGLGLLLCKELVELHQGHIKVESEIDKGSRFIITLPKKQTHS